MVDQHENIRSLLGPYALDAVEPLERRAVDAHLPDCDPCREEVAEFLEVASLLGGVSDGIEAPSRAWEAIATRLHTPSRRQATAWSTLLAVAATAAAVVASVIMIGQRSQIESLRSDLAASASAVAEARVETESLRAQVSMSGLELAASGALADPTASLVRLGGDLPERGDVTIVLTADGTGYVAADTLPPLPDDRTYQLWAVVDDRVISAGVLGSDPGVVAFRIDPDGLQALAVTEEIAGGVVTSANPAIAAWSAEG